MQFFAGIQFLSMGVMGPSEALGALLGQNPGAASPPLPFLGPPKTSP